MDLTDYITLPEPFINKARPRDAGSSGFWLTAVHISHACMCVSVHVGGGDADAERLSRRRAAVTTLQRAFVVGT